MNHRLCTCLAALLAALSLMGCGAHPSAKLIGKWKLTGISSSGAANNANDLSAAFAKKIADEVLKSSNVQYEFQEGGKLRAQFGLIGKEESVNGTWSFVKSEGNDLVVKVNAPPTFKDSEVRITFSDKDHCSFATPAAVSANAGNAEFTRLK